VSRINFKEKAQFEKYSTRTRGKLGEAQGIFSLVYPSPSALSHMTRYIRERGKIAKVVESITSLIEFPQGPNEVGVGGSTDAVEKLLDMTKAHVHCCSAMKILKSTRDVNRKQYLFIIFLSW